VTPDSVHGAALNHRIDRAALTSWGHCAETTYGCRVLEIVEDVVGVGDLDDFRLALLRSLMRVVPSDWASLNDLGPNPGEEQVLGRGQRCRRR
jgi:hypothetical protein